MAQTINVDVTPSLFQPTLYYHQGDIGREFAINISTKDGYEIPSGATVKIEATKPSGFGFSVEGTLSGNTVTFVSTEGMTDEFGRFPAQLKISSGNTVIYTANFLMVGEKDTHPASTVDGSQEDVIPQLTLLVERVENAAAAVLDTTTEVTTLPAGSQATYSFDEETNTATFGIPEGEAGAGSAGVVASAYSASKTYAVGDYAIHNSNLYRCTTAITTAESFNASHWTQVVLADDVTDLKSDTDELSEIVIGTNIFTDTNVRGYSNNTAITNNNDGTYTVGTTDYGVTMFGTSVDLPAGIYCLYGVPFGYSFLSTTANNSGQFQSNPTSSPLWFTLTSGRTCYIGYRATSRPKEAFTIKPYLHGVGLRKDVEDLKTIANSLPSDYLANNDAKATAITSGDLNTYTTVGNYKITATAYAEAVSNTPVDEAGRIVVLTVANTNNLIQYYITNNGIIYYRIHNANGWGTWAYIANSSHINALATKASPAFTGVPTAPTAPNGTSTTQIATTQFVASAVNALGVPIATNAAAVSQISENADLNDYLTVGNYRIGTSSTAITIANIPFNDAGRLIVMGVGHPNTTMQIYIANTRHIFMRTHTASGWSVWQELVLNTDEYKALYTDVDRINVASQGLYSFIKVLESMGIYNVRFANAPVPLNLQNYVTGYAGNTQNVHPKVLYFPSRFGGHYYWMAYTPYPYGRSQYENPCIAYSDDGYSWTNIEGNPLDDPQGNGYNSDTHLVYRNDTGTLECWYRYVSNGSDRYETIYRQTSTDGITWSAKETVFQSTTSGATHYLSPAVEWDGSKYRIWVVDGTSIVYYEAVPSNLTAWTRIRSYSIPFTDDGQSANPWHLDVIRDGGTYIMFVICMVSSSPRNKWSLFITTSSDNITYSTPTKVVEGASDSWDPYMYRSSIVKVGNTYRIYYSAMDADTVCGIGITESASLSNFIGKLIL